MKNSVFAVGSVGDKMNSQNVGFSVGGEPESPSQDRRSSLNLFVHRAHSRSSSWSFPGSARPGPSDLGSSLASINPIRSVIREFVPSLDPTNENSHSPSSHTGLDRRDDEAIPLNYITQSRGDTPPTTVNSDHSLSSEDSNNRDQPFADTSMMVVGTGNVDIDAGNIELSEGLRWIEQNAIFFILLLIRYAWMHKSGMCVHVYMCTYVCISKCL